MKKQKTITVKTDDFIITYDKEVGDKLVKKIERLIVKEYSKACLSKITFKRFINDYAYYCTENNTEKFHTFSRYFVLFSTIANIIAKNYFAAIILGICTFLNILLLILHILYKEINKELDNLSEEEREYICDKATEKILDLINSKGIKIDDVIIESEELNKED